MSGQNRRRFEVATHAESSAQPSISVDAYQWYAQQADGDASRRTPQEELSNQAFRQRLLEMEKKHTAKSAELARRLSANRIPSNITLDKRAHEAYDRSKAIEEGSEVYQIFKTRVEQFDPTQQAQIVQEQPARFKKAELTQQAELDRQPNLMLQALQLELALQAELAQRAESRPPGHQNPL